MLYASDLQFNFLFTFFVSKSGLIHYDYDFKSKSYHLLDTKWRKAVFYAMQSVCAMRVCVAVYLMFYFKANASTPFLYTLIAYGFSLGMVAVALLQVMLYRIHGLYPGTMNDFLSILPSDRGRLNLHSLLNVKAIEALLILCPSIVFTSGTLVGIAGYLVDPDLPVQLWVLVPDAHRNPVTLYVSALLDATFLSIIATCIWNVVVIGSVVVLLFDHLLDDVHRKVTGALQQSLATTSLADLMDELTFEIRCACIRLQMFNAEASYIVYGVKQSCLFLSVMGIFIGIKYADRIALVSSAAFCFAITCTVFYNAVFDKAFAFPSKMQNICDIFLHASQRLPSRAQRDYYRLITKSVLYKGIQVGSFQTLERQSTLNYLGFVSQETSSLLIGSDVV